LDDVEGSGDKEYVSRSSARRAVPINLSWQMELSNGVRPVVDHVGVGEKILGCDIFANSAFLGTKAWNDEPSTRGFD
jgi:hypothetical protein